MARPKKNAEPVIQKLDEISIVLQNMLIIECARAGIKKSNAREIVGCDMNRVTRIWKDIKTGLEDKLS